MTVEVLPHIFSPRSKDQSYRDDISEPTGIIGISLMLYNPEKYYIGISLPHASVRGLGTASPEDKRHWKNAWYVAGGYLQQLNETFLMKPSLLPFNQQ